MRLGPTLTIFATLAPLLDIATVDTLSGHVRDAYPDQGPGMVAADRNTVVIYLVVTGVLGILGWLLPAVPFLAPRSMRARARPEEHPAVSSVNSDKIADLNQ